MGKLKVFGFRIYRLKDMKETEEFLLYNIETKQYNLYNFKRLKSILLKELELKGINFAQYCKEEAKESGVEVYKPIVYFNNIIEEEYELINSLGYKPSDEIIFKENNKILFNIYNKSKLLTKLSTVENKGFPNIELLLLNLVNNNKEEYDYFISWIAWQIQNPLTRLTTSIIFQGEHGTGKTKFCELVLKPIFENNFCEIGQADINKDYNEYILGKQIIVANEVIHNDNKFLVPDKLKNYVTDEFLSINRKFKDLIYVKNYAQWIFVSNNNIPLKIEKGDRRYSVFKSLKLKNGFKLISSLMKNHETELNSFLAYLRDLKVDFEYVNSPIENSAKKEIIKSSNNSIEEFIDVVIEYNGFENLFNHYSNENILTKKQFVYCNSNKELYISLKEIYKLYLIFCNDYGYSKTFARSTFTRHLKYLNYTLSVQNIDKVSTRVVMLQ